MTQLVVGGGKQTGQFFKRLRYIGELFTSRERFIIGVCSILLLVSIVFSGVRYYLVSTTVVPIVGGEYVEALVGQPQYINPILAQANDVDLDLTRLMFSGLFRRSKDQVLEKDLVSDYTISEDKLTYTLFIRRDAQWHDGQPLTANDILFTIQAIQDPVYQSPLEPSLRGVQAELVDDYTVKLILKETFAPFLSSLTFGILPQHIWGVAYTGSLQNVTLSEYNIRPVGSGQWKFDALVKDTGGNIKAFQLMPFEQYYGTKPYLEKLSFKFYPDSAAAVTAVQNKQVDGLAFVNTSQKQALQAGHRTTHYYRLQLPQYVAIFFNQEHSDTLAKDAVRQALVWGVDRDRMIQEALQGDGESIYAPILPGYVGYNPEIQKYGFDIEKGKTMLDEAGWKLPEGGEYRAKDNTVLEFSIATVNQPYFVKTLDILKENWTKMGVKVNVNVYEPTDIQEQIVKPREYEALLFGEVLGVDPDPYAFWHSTQMDYPGLGLAVFYQKNIDDLLETARKTNDEEQRRLKYFNFQNILAEELPAIFLYNPYYTYVLASDMMGASFQYITTPADRFSDITNWYMKTKRVKK